MAQGDSGFYQGLLIGLVGGVALAIAMMVVLRRPVPTPPPGQAKLQMGTPVPKPQENFGYYEMLGKEGKETPPPRKTPPAAAPRSAEDLLKKEPVAAPSPSQSLPAPLPQAEQPLAMAPPAPKPPVMASTAPPRTSRTWFVLGSYPERGAAEAQKARLAFLGIESRVADTGRAGAGRYVLRSGPYTSPQKAAQVQKALAANSVAHRRVDE